MLNWRIRFNPGKCEVPSMTRKHNPTPSTINSSSGSTRRKTLGLGVIISNYLKGRSQIHLAVSKRYQMLSFQRRHANKDFDISDCRKALYLTFIRPTIGYATQVWGPSSLSDILKINKKSAAVLNSVHSV